MPHPRPSWPRRVRRLCQFLLLGLVTTVGVAWGVAIRPIRSALSVRTPGIDGVGGKTLQDPCFHSTSHLTTGRVLRVWSSAEDTIQYIGRLEAAERAGVPSVQSHRRERVTASVCSLVDSSEWGVVHTHYRAFNDGQFGSAGSEQAVGWPMLALWCGVEYAPSDGPTPATEVAPARSPTLLGGIPYAPAGPPVGTTNAMRDPTRLRALPLLPIWPGLAFNTLFYALLWWLTFASVRMVKHNRRYRRGLCPICRYDLRADYSQGCSECGWKRA